MKAGALEVLTKPPEGEELLKAVRHCVARNGRPSPQTGRVTSHQDDGIRSLQINKRRFKPLY